MSSDKRTENNEDKEFEPTIDMMIHDFDDEQTLEDEERLAAAEQANPESELDQLQKEGDMPLDQLLAMYYNQPMDDDDEEDEESSGETEKIAETSQPVDTETVGSDVEEESDLKRLYPAGVNSLNAILAAAEDSDDDYQPEESDNRKKIMVGSEHQAQIPEYGFLSSDPDYDEKEDQLVWSGSDLSNEDIVEYLKRVKQLCPPRNVDTTWTAGDESLETSMRHVRDDEKALSVLRECNNNVEAALNRIKSEMQPAETCWSEEECEKFEAGLLVHGKNFHEIKESKLTTKTVGELIQFYYHWKKSERYDAFVSKNRLDKKKYNANSGPCIMDRFLDDQEGTSITGTNGLHPRDINNSLLSADAKRRHDKHEPQPMIPTDSNDPVN